MSNKLTYLTLTDNAERKFTNTTEFSNEWGSFIATIIDGQPVKWTMIGARANFTHRTCHYIFASVNKVKKKSTLILSPKIKEKRYGLFSNILPINVFFYYYFKKACPSLVHCDILQYIIYFWNAREVFTAFNDNYFLLASLYTQKLFSYNYYPFN